MGNFCLFPFCFVVFAESRDVGERRESLPVSFLRQPIVLRCCSFSSGLLHPRPLPHGSSALMDVCAWEAKVSERCNWIYGPAGLFSLLREVNAPRRRQLFIHVQDKCPPDHPTGEGPRGGWKQKVAYISADPFWWHNKDARYFYYLSFSHWDLKQSSYLCCKAAGEK